MKLYTRTGDDGTTGTFGGPRVPKDGLRMEATGTVDELNSALGLAVTVSTEAMTPLLKDLQSRLFDLGADLATPVDSSMADKTVRITDEHVAAIERAIDEASRDLPDLQSFILPGGTELAARLHLARTIARRAERRIVTLAEAEPVGAATVPFINRISDLLFALARRANHDAGVEDVPWRPKR
jgi:cob(I)alamin adenosyltransferase